MKKLFFFAAVLFAGSMMAADQLINGINYSLDGEKLEATVIAKDPIYSGDVVIPATVVNPDDSQTYNIVAIGDNAFAHCVDLTSISLPEGLKKIGFDSFWECTKLTSLTLPSTLETIGSYAFELCDQLKTINLPNSVTSVGAYAFSGDTSLTAPVYNDKIFAYMPELFEGDYVIPDGIESITQYAFCMANLKSLSIPNSVTNIESSAFSYCRKLETVTFNANVTKINSSVFYECSSLKSFTVPASVTLIDSYAFYNCDELETVTFNEGLQTISQQAFYSCDKLSALSLPASVTYISPNVFSGCASLASIHVAAGNSVYDSRNSCNALIKTAKDELVLGSINATVPEGIKSIGENAFRLLPITSLTLPESLVAIGDYAFEACIELTSINLPANVTSVGKGAFRETGLTNQLYNSHVFAFMPRNFAGAFAVPEGITHIASNAFTDCVDLTAITFPASLTYIGFDSFWNTRLSEVVIPEGVDTISTWAFEQIPTLHKVTLPSTLKKLDEKAFYYCTALDTIIVNAETPLEIVENVFDDVDIATCKLFVPTASIALYEAADVWKNFDIRPIAELPTAIENTAVEAKAAKRLVNGQLVIEKNGRTYNALGAEVK